MRIGVAVKDTKPTAGGAFTLETTIINGLEKNNQGHEFIILNLSHSESRQLPSIACYDVNQMFNEVGSISNVKKLVVKTRDVLLPAKLATSITRMVKKVVGFISREDSDDTQIVPLSALDKAAKYLELDVIWYIGIHFSEVSIPFFFTVYDLAHRIHPWFPEVSTEGWRWAQRERLFNNVLPRASKIITGTNIGKMEIETFYNVFSENIEIVPYPVPTLGDKSTANDYVDVKAKYKLPERFFLYPAQFWAHKNHINLLMAINWVRSHANKEINLVLVGADQGNREHVEKAIKKYGLESQVNILGFIPEGDLLALYKRATGLSFVSYFGPDNLPPLEAFANSCPVIAANIPGASEQLQDAAIFVDPNDPESIGKALIRVDEDSELCSSLINNGIEIVKHKTIEIYLDQMLTIFNKFERVKRNWK